MNIETGLRRSTVTGTERHLRSRPAARAVQRDGGNGRPPAVDEGDPGPGRAALRAELRPEAREGLAAGLRRRDGGGAQVETHRRSRRTSRKQQIESLPQSTRNFLNFAVLAPGVRLSHDELRQEIQLRRAGLDEHERLHRRHELQERRPPRRLRRAGLEPREPLPAERRPGVPRHHAELQGGVPEGLERHHQRP